MITDKFPKNCNAMKIIIFLLFMLAKPMIALAQEDIIDPVAQQLNERINVIWNDVNADNFDSYKSFRKDFKAKDVSYLDCRQCDKLVKLICYMRANSDYDTDADCLLFDAIVENNSCRESLMFIIAYYDNYNLFPEKKIIALKRFTEKYAPTTFISYHYGKALINGEGCPKDVQAGIDKLVEATQIDRDDFSMMAKVLLVELWNSDGNKYNNMLGRLCAEYGDAMKVWEKYYWVYNETTFKVGLLDSLANEVLPVKYEDVNNNIDDLFVVTTDKGEELVTKGGLVISKNAFKRIDLGKFADGSYFISVNDGENWGLLNADGTPATDMVFYDISVPSFFFQKPTLTLLVDDNENPLIQYTMEEAFKQGFAIVSDNNKYGIMDEHGRLVVECIYDHILRSDGCNFTATKGQKETMIKL